jgi:hypothetical protein
MASDLPTGKSAGKPLSWLKRAEHIAKISTALQKAEPASGYRLENLIQLLTREDLTSAVAKTSAKAVNKAEKKTAKKTDVSVGKNKTGKRKKG